MSLSICLHLPLPFSALSCVSIELSHLVFVLNGLDVDEWILFLSNSRIYIYTYIVLISLIVKHFNMALAIEAHQFHCLKCPIFHPFSFVSVFIERFSPSDHFLSCCVYAANLGDLFNSKLDWWQAEKLEINHLICQVPWKYRSSCIYIYNISECVS